MPEGPCPRCGSRDADQCGHKLIKHDWAQLITNAPARLPAPRGQVGDIHPLWAHDENCPGSCTRADGTRLAPKTLKHLCAQLLVWANVQGTNLHPGVKLLVLATGMKRGTVIAGMGHLVAKGLLDLREAANSRDMDRRWANLYWLAFPEGDPELTRIIFPAAAEDGDVAVEVQDDVLDEVKPDDSFSWFARADEPLDAGAAPAGTGGTPAGTSSGGGGTGPRSSGLRAPASILAAAGRRWSSPAPSVPPSGES